MITTTASAGIDYGGGLANIDTATGIRYGVVSQHSVGDHWYESGQPDYGDPTCPKCGNVAQQYDHDALAQKHGEASMDNWECSGEDYVCESCEYTFDSSEAYGDEPNGWSYEEEGYLLTDCLQSDIMVIKSPYYTLARFCSPCVPGAGNLDSPDSDYGIRTYCLGHEWFQNSRAPYPVYRVGTSEWVPEPE